MRKLGGNFGRDEEARTANIGLAIWRLKCFYETFVQGSTAVILFPRLTQSRGRCASCIVTATLTIQNQLIQVFSLILYS